MTVVVSGLTTDPECFIVKISSHNTRTERGGGVVGRKGTKRVEKTQNNIDSRKSLG